MIIDILADLKQYLLNTPYAKENSSGTHVMIRCPICGDSTKHLDSTHCYVNIVYGKPVSYYCFSNCSSGHYVDELFLNSIGISDPEMIYNIKKYNLSFLNNNSKYKESIKKKTNLNIPDYIDRYKLSYIENRLSCKIENISELKIIFSIYDFIRINNLNYNMTENMIELLDKKYVGFLSADNSYIIFRNTESNKMRYINYPIYNDSGNWGYKTYIISTEINLMSDSVECNLAEGIFDIMSCYLNINKKNKKNKLYISVNGSGYLGLIKRILHMGFIGNLDINIYSDKDKPPEYYNNLKIIKKFCKSIKLFYNNYPGEKDIGTFNLDIKQYKIV